MELQLFEEETGVGAAKTVAVAHHAVKGCFPQLGDNIHGSGLRLHLFNVCRGADEVVLPLPEVRP